MMIHIILMKKSISSNGNAVGEKVSAETNSQKDLIKSLLIKMDY